MTSFDLIEITSSDWTKIEGFSSKGKRVKYWVENNISGDVYLFKEPKRYGSTNFITQEIWTEYIAYEIGKFIGLDIPEAIPAKDKDGYGILIKSFMGKLSSHSAVKELTDAKEILGRTNAIRAHNLQFIKLISELNSVDTSFWINYKKMMIFDCLIGNNDRHDENWGFLFDSGKTQFKLAPIYDNASCLTSGLEEEKIIKMFNDYSQIEKYVMKSKPPNLYINQTDSTHYNHYKIIEYLIKVETDMKKLLHDSLQFEYIDYVDGIIQNIQQLDIEEDYRLSDNRREVILNILYERKQKLQELVNVYI